MEYVTQEFLNNKWKHVKNTNIQQVFEKNDREFVITNKYNNKIIVSFPLQNSPYNYVATIQNTENFDSIYEYISDR